MHSDTLPPAAYEIAGKRWPKDAPGFPDAIAFAFEHRLRPRCLCRKNSDGQGIEMYVARLMDGYIVKRMPNSGHHHAASCLSYEPPAESSGLGQVLGTAIVEDPATGETTLMLDFPLTKIPGRSRMPPAGVTSDSVTSDGTKLSLLGLLHYLWHQADLTRWYPGFVGKRHWATVRRHLLAAAAPMLARGDPLVRRLYLPETFIVEQHDAINARRLAQWTPALAQPGKANPLMLLIGEVKEIVPSRFGFKAIIKHVPDQAFAIDERLYRRLERHFTTELELWGTDDAVRLIVIATFGVTHAGLPCIDALSLMTLTAEWIPIANCFESHLVRSMVRGQRSFVKALRYNHRADNDMACALLTDTAEAIEMFIHVDKGSRLAEPDAVHDSSSEVDKSWTWRPPQQAFPPIPPKSSDRNFSNFRRLSA